MYDEVAPEHRNTDQHSNTDRNSRNTEVQPLKVLAVRYISDEQTEVYELTFVYGLRGFERWFSKEMLGLTTQVGALESDDRAKTNTILMYRHPTTKIIEVREHMCTGHQWFMWSAYVDRQATPPDEERRRGRKPSIIQRLTTWKDRHVH